MTTGEQIAVSVLPFMTSKHNLTRNECVEIVSKPIDRSIDELVGELKKTEDLLINLTNAGWHVAMRLERVRGLIKKYSQ
jgi:hypothetical protein